MEGYSSQNSKKIGNIGSNPLVSIVVITYNSANYILETLDSCKNQSYHNIELIISDDASQDNTIQICAEWIEKNRNKFKSIQLIESSVNSGIAPNLNRGIYKSEGEWIKILAGDDILMPDIISIYIKHIICNPKIKILHSNPIIYEQNQFNEVTYQKKDNSYLDFNSNHINAKKQFNILLYSNPIFASSVMIHISLFKKVGYYDEKSAFWEDGPFWLKVTSYDEKIYYLNEYGIKYRRSSDSIRSTGILLISKYLISKTTYKYNFLYNYYTWYNKIAISQQYYILKLILKYGNKRNVFSRVAWFFSNKITGLTNKIDRYRFQI